MAGASLAHYDGSAGFLVDSNLWIDCIAARSDWHEWAVDQIQACSERAPLHINLIIYTELLVPAPDVGALNAMLDVYEVQRSALPWSCAALAAKAFGLYRQRGGQRRTPLPDFYIGAHAAVANLAVLTRDSVGYASYFPKLKIIGPTARGAAT